MSPAADASDKAAARRSARAVRDAIADRAAAARSLAEVVLAEWTQPTTACVTGYWPTRGEIDPRPLLSVLSERGHTIGLPVVAGPAQPLVFRMWRPGDALVEGSFAIMTPPETAPEVTPDALLVPLLAFDRRGFRLGYGGGFYDRTLAKLRAAGHVYALGVAFAAQQVEAVPRTASDEPLDALATEQELIHFERAASLTPED
ncbi:MAG: 5-formyltetrahydrofolate cyclo-ligase [Alphaproteobacteria bacterium]|nr:5-formyltetrahydrofolate cyclo-ligase [Alphaproteobacteria bacterium]